MLAWLQADGPDHRDSAARQAKLTNSWAMRSSAGDAHNTASDLSSQLLAHRAYQSNTHATAARVLSNHFPTVLAMLGQEALAVLARRLWQEHPPVSGDLGQWGSELPTLIAIQPELSSWPWLADCARLDWACHTCERSADAQLDVDSLQRLGDSPAEQLGLEFHPSVRLLASSWPVVSLWQAHRLPDSPERDAAVQAALTQAPETAVAWRHPWQAEVARLSPADAQWMHGWLQAGLHATLADALSHMALAQAPACTDPCANDQDTPSFDFAGWLTKALSHGWLWRVSVKQPR
jgi:hypothetical protein